MRGIIDVSVIIVNWNTRDILRDCLRSVYAETAGIDFEVVVVDNASADGSAAMVRAEFPRAILIENRENRGFAAGNNQAMRVATGRYVLLLNSDTVVLDGAVQKTVAFADAHPDTAVVGCYVLHDDGSRQRSCFLFPSLLNVGLMVTYLWKMFPRSRFCGRQMMSWWQGDDSREVEVVSGCFMCVRMEAIRQVGLFDESFYFYGEEADWCRRFRTAGWRLLYTPGARIIHLAGASARVLGWRSDAMLTRALVRLFRKHYAGWYARTAEALLWLFNGSRVIWWWLVAWCSGREKAAGRYRHFWEIWRHWGIPDAVLWPRRGFRPMMHSKAAAR